MKKLILIFFLAFYFSNLSQIEIVDPSSSIISSDKLLKNDSSVFDIVDVPASFPGGISACRFFILEHLIYPEKALENSIEGMVYLVFIIDKNGTIRNIQVEKGIPNCQECDAEAIRIVSIMPKWEPAKVDNQVVHSTFRIPIRFKILFVNAHFIRKRRILVCEQFLFYHEWS